MGWEKGKDGGWVCLCRESVRKETRFFLLLLTETSLALQTAANSTAECGGHGHLHGKACECDAGYEPTNDGLSCEKHDDHDHGV